MVKKVSRHFLDQSEVKPKPIVICSHVFSRAWHGRHVFASSSDWFIWLLTTVVIGQSNYFGFTTQMKTALTRQNTPRCLEYFGSLPRRQFEFGEGPEMPSGNLPLFQSHHLTQTCWCRRRSCETNKRKRCQWKTQWSTLPSPPLLRLPCRLRLFFSKWLWSRYDFIIVCTKNYALQRNTAILKGISIVITNWC